MGIQFSAINHNDLSEVTFEDGRTFSFPSLIEVGEEWEFFGFSNANARAVLGVLGFEAGECGEFTLADGRRAVMRARATFERRAGAFTRESEHVPGGTAGVRTVREGNVTRVQRMGAEMFSVGLDESGLADRVERIAAFIEAAAHAGATGVSWG